QPIAPSVGFEVADVIEQHNRNALRVTSYEAAPAVSIQPGKGRMGTMGGAARGKLYIEPGSRNFRMILNYMAAEKIDIGSNNDRFWVWSPDTFGNNSVYTCSYDESGDIPLPALYQPDWIMETMGLSALPLPGGPGVTVRSDGGDAILEQRRTGSDGAVVVKETVVSGLTRKVAEHRLYQLAPDGRKELAARAVIKEPGNFAVAASDGGEATIELPGVIQLIIPAEGLDMTMSVKKVMINQGFDRDQHSRLFNPSKRGNAEMKDLRAALGMPGESTMRETMPAPPSGVRLNEPLPAASAEPPASTRTPKSGQSTASTSRASSKVKRADLRDQDIPEPGRLGGGSASSPLQGFVGAPIPRPPG
ncbi:MAG: hypothetical protein U0800_22260, partial [Isosphaeraceae bacterium]